MYDVMCCVKTSPPRVQPVLKFVIVECEHHSFSVLLKNHPLIDLGGKDRCVRHLPQRVSWGVKLGFYVCINDGLFDSHRDGVLSAFSPRLNTPSPCDTVRRQSSKKRAAWDPGNCRLNPLEGSGEFETTGRPKPVSSAM